MPAFDFEDDDYEAVEVASAIARRFLRDERLTAPQSATLIRALNSLEMLPETIPGLAIEFGVELSAGDDSHREMRYIVVRIDEVAFEISTGGYVYSSAVGGDSVSRPSWRIEVAGYRDTTLDLSSIEDDVTEFLNLGA